MIRRLAVAAVNAAAMAATGLLWVADKIADRADRVPCMWANETGDTNE